MRFEWKIQLGFAKRSVTLLQLIKQLGKSMTVKGTLENLSEPASHGNWQVALRAVT